MKFTKMEGLGNDYVYVNAFTEKVENPGELARRIADRHFGVGGDGLILIEPSDKADAYMHMFNADGSEGSMCGNGIRCVAKYIYDHGIVEKERRQLRIETKSGIKDIEIFVKDGKMEKATVDMGEVKLDGELPENIEVRGMSLQFVGIDVGNPHAVYFLEDNPELSVSSVSELDLEKIGKDFEEHPRFPDKVNAEFIQVLSPSEIRFRVYERGSGETLACGTGATAAVVAGILMGRLEDKATVHLLGGDLEISYDKKNGHAFMTGPAREVFNGEWI